MIINNTSDVSYLSVLPDGSTLQESLTSNEVSTEIITYSFTKVKSSPKTFIVEGEQAEQTVLLTNNSGYTVTNVQFKDNMSAGASFVPGTVYVDNVVQPLYDPTVGFALPDIASGGSTEVRFSIVADKPATQTPVTDFAAITYTVDDPIAGPTTYTENTNDLSLDVVSVDLNVVKSVDKAIAVKGDTLTYTTVITNNSDQDASLVQFKDVVPAGLTFVPDSLTVDGVAKPGISPETGINLSNIPVGSSVTVVFKATVD